MKSEVMRAPNVYLLRISGSVIASQSRSGVGGALLQRVGGLAVERECGRLEWSVLDWNQLAIDFYVGRGARIMTEWRICRVEGAAFQTFLQTPIHSKD